MPYGMGRAPRSRRASAGERGTSPVRFESAPWSPLARCEMLWVGPLRRRRRDGQAIDRIGGAEMNVPRLHVDNDVGDGAPGLRLASSS